MKKYLLLAGLFAILTFNSAHAQGYYYEDDSDYVEQPRRVRRVNYQQPEYREVEYVREQAPHYRKISSKDVVHKPQSEYRQARYYSKPKTIKIYPYIGLDIDTAHVNFEKKDFEKIADDQYNSITGVVGFRGKYVGIETFYRQSFEQEKNITNNAKVITDYKAYGADLIGYIPLNEHIELLTTFGFGRYDMNAKVKVGDYKVKENEIDNGYRLGIGAQYYITDNIALRGMFRYIKMKDDDIIKNLTEFSLGMRYMF